LLLDLFTAGKFWQLLGFETKIGKVVNFVQFKMLAIIVDFPLFCPTKISLGRFAPIFPMVLRAHCCNIRAEEILNLKRKKRNRLSAWNTRTGAGCLNYFFISFFFSKNPIISKQIQQILMNTQVLHLFDFLEDLSKVLEHFELNFLH
jgi:hypothetical protein